MITHKCTYLDSLDEIVTINEFERTSKDTTPTCLARGHLFPQDTCPPAGDHLTCGRASALISCRIFTIRKPDFLLYNYKTIINNIPSSFSPGRKRAEVQSRRKWGCLALKRRSILSRKGCAQTEWHWAQVDSVGKVPTLFMFYSVFLVRRRGRSSPRGEEKWWLTQGGW